MAVPADLVKRLRRRVGQLVLGDEGHTDAEWEDAATARLPPEAFERQLDDAASYVACIVAQARPGLLRQLRYS